MTKIDTLPLFGLNLVNADRPTAIDTLLNDPRRLTVSFLNAHCVNVAAKDRVYSQALKASTYVLPDGSGLSIAAKLTGRRFTENLNGTDLYLPLAAAAARAGQSVFLLGARPGVAEAAAEAAQAHAPGLKIAGCRDGFFDEQDSGAVIDEINRSGADILLVALGVPKQEVWLYRHRRDINARLVMGVGAMFDFHAGEVSRAPSALRRAGLEWTWRLAIEPRRMASRYLLGNPAFLMRAARNALTGTVRPAMPVWKRALDLTASMTALAIFAPVFLGVALAVRSTSQGPILFRQTRVGLNGKTFTMFKFRSMYTEPQSTELKSDRDGICFKQKDDPRVTPVGRFIRRYSLDELPQIFNVLKGEMSLVGPRPALPKEVAAYPPQALKRLESVPGLTGIWQVSGRADVSFEQMIQMDLAYKRSRSLLLDLVLIAATARAVLGGRGAY